MADRGFLAESKSFIVYKNLTTLGKINFWIKFPFVYLKYIHLMYFNKDIKLELQLRKDYELSHEQSKL